MKDKDKKVRHWLTQINALLDEHDWSESAVLRACKKKLMGIQGRLQSHAQAADSGAVDKEELGHDWSTYVPVYISVYQVDGEDMKQWAMGLCRLKEYSAGRPVYKEESAVRAAIAQKKDLLKEGYIRLYVREDETVKSAPGMRARDKLGVELLILRPKAFDSNRVDLFVHANLYKFHFRNGRLSAFKE